METTEIDPLLKPVLVFEFKEPEMHTLYLYGYRRIVWGDNILISHKFLLELSNLLLRPDTELCTKIKTALQSGAQIPLGLYDKFMAKKLPKKQTLFLCAGTVVP